MCDRVPKFVRAAFQGVPEREAPSYEMSYRSAQRYRYPLQVKVQVTYEMLSDRAPKFVRAVTTLKTSYLGSTPPPPTPLRCEEADYTSPSDLIVTQNQF